jgi:phytoene dehydrogenase-like protein
MANAGSNVYDVVIVGAGLGGLVCGCYLAKAGLKVLIAEQHFKPGGYCTSFRRKRFTFDAGPHCFGSYRSDGLTRKILQDLGVDRKLQIQRADPTDVIITPEHTINIWNDLTRTQEELQSQFPEEKKGLDGFMQFIVKPDANAYPRIRRWTLRNLLDAYFKNEKLIASISAPLLAFHGLPPSQMSAFVGSKLFSEFLFDGGYVPHGGMQALSDALADVFRSSGGELRLSSLVQKIVTKEGAAAGIEIQDQGYVPSRCVVSACDARQTFFSFLDNNIVEKEFADMLDGMKPSLSNFLLYVGVERDFQTPLKPGVAYCYCPHYDLERIYHAATRMELAGDAAYTIRISHDASTINGYLLAPYQTKGYWEKNKQGIAEQFLQRMAAHIPGLPKHIECQDAATPSTLNRYTLNYQGASYGWAGTPSQFAIPGFRKPAFVRNLYMAGHWTTFGVGISGVIYFAYDTAKTLIKKSAAMRL